MYDMRKRIEGILSRVGSVKVKRVDKIENILYKECDFKQGSEMPDISDMKPWGAKDLWGGGIEKHAWFYAKVNFEKSEYKRLLKISSMLSNDSWYNPQIMLYIDGQLRQGMDANHTDYLIEEEGEHDVFIYACTRHADHRIKPSMDSLFFSMCIQHVDEVVEKLCYDITILYEILDYADKNSDEYISVYKALENAIALLDMRDLSSKAFIDSAKKASAYLDKNFYGKDKGEKPMVACIGHTHIDLAWLWRERQTVEKAQRSFATVLELMRRYPSYKFMSSQVPLYKYVKRECPALYERIKERVKEGRWEPEGGMYVEADCNISGNEGLVRQFVYGKRFFKDEFGVDSKVLWLPDVFGYSAALPQIMKKCGVDDFVTSKISWNETNMMPYDTFSWKGIDGSSVTTHFILGQRSADIVRFNTYNSQISASTVYGTYYRNLQRQVSSQALMTVGYGDGGGGTTVDDIEKAQRMKNPLPALPSARFVSLKDYIKTAKENIEKNKKELPEWVGELYLEFHRGTYTSQANNKKFNRRSEFEMCSTEALSVIANKFGIDGFEQSKHDEIWEEILFNQFHDILPGSSINGVYKDTAISYGKILGYTSALSQKLIHGIAKKVQKKGILVFNPNSYAYSGAVEIDGKRVLVENVPPKGYKVVEGKSATSKVKATKNALENKFFRVTFDKNKNITSVYDKRNDREVLKENKCIRYISYEDMPHCYDAWELQEYYTEKPYAVDEVLSSCIVKDMDRVGIKTVRKLGSSTIEDVVYLYDNCDKIEFVDNIDWSATNTVLKREFPLDLVSDKATCEIQYGYAERPTHKNTSWDSAKFEVCAQKYVDISESNYGVSLINDSKFGHGLYNNDITLTLLRSPKNPDKECDMGKHEIKYALCPHSGSLSDSDTVKKAYEINNPCIAVCCDGGSGEMPDEYSLVSVKDNALNVEVVKLADRGEGVVIRAYDCKRSRGKAEISLAFGQKAYLCDMLENEIEEVEIKDGKIILPYKPFEIITLKVK